MTKNLDFNYLFDPEFDFFNSATNEKQVASQTDEAADEIISADSAPLVHKQASKYSDRPAEERIENLLESMKGQRKIFLQTLAFCNRPKTINDVNDYIAQLQKIAPSVYSPANICAFLEQAGALQRQTADGMLASDLDPTPKTIQTGDMEYLEPTQAPQTFWMCTQAGNDALTADNPAQRLTSVIEQEKRYRPIYQKIIALCSRAEGASISQLSDAIDDDPLLKEPRYYVQRFVNKLEECDAITWNDSWFATKTGIEFLTQNVS